MTKATVSKLKASLSKYLARVKAGEEIIVMDRGRPVARLVPILRDEEAASLRLLALERAGLARIGTGLLPAGFWEQPRPEDEQGAALAALLQEREEGR